MSGAQGNADSGSVYGTLGVGSAATTPGHRAFAISAVSPSGDLLLYGGSWGNAEYYNDLWKFDGTYWTWIAGSSSPGQAGVYGTRGTPALSNEISARRAHHGAIDAEGSIWLFGGTNGTSYFNDLWKISSW
jgi:hypothetical protein